MHPEHFVGHRVEVRQVAGELVHGRICRAELRKLFVQPTLGVRVLAHLDEGPLNVYQVLFTGDTLSYDAP